jgi:hypothetical protein
MNKQSAKKTDGSKNKRNLTGLDGTIYALTCYLYNYLVVLRRHAVNTKNR